MYTRHALAMCHKCQEHPDLLLLRRELNVAYRTGLEETRATIA